MRVDFSELFTVQNGMISPKTNVQIGGAIIGPGGSFSASGGASVGGVDLSQYIGKVLEADNQNGVWVIQGFYS